MWKASNAGNSETEMRMKIPGKELRRTTMTRIRMMNLMMSTWMMSMRVAVQKRRLARV